MLSPLPFDLIAVVADADAEQALRGILKRHHALGISEIRFGILREPQRNPGCRIKSAELLRPFLGKASHAVVVFDHEGSGAERSSPEDIEHRVEQELERNGWASSRIAVVVISPELENWVWGSMAQLERVCRWSDRVERLDHWIQAQGFLAAEATKPSRPKEALQAALKETKTPFSPSLFRQLSDRVTLRNCQDRAFNKLTERLRAWFPSPQMPAPIGK